MATFSPQEVHIPIDGQTIIKLDHPYVVGTNELVVYLNGLIAILGQDYTEKDESSIEFLFQLSSEDIIVTQHNVYFDDINVNVIDGRNSLYQSYGDAERLLKNQEYTVRFEYKGQVLSSSFTTKVEPLYSTVPILRNDLGEFLSGIKDQRLVFLIYQNSILGVNLAPEDSLDFTDGTPYYLKQFVRYRTELDIALAIYLSISGKGSSDHMVLGQLEVEKRYRLEDIKPLLAELKMKLKPWEKQLKGTSSRIAAGAVRGGTSNPYPLNTPRRGEDYS